MNNNNVILASFGSTDKSFSEFGWTQVILLSPVEYKDGQVILPAGTMIHVDIERSIGRYNDESFHIMPDEYFIQIQAAN